MNKSLVIILREYLVMVRKKSFLISTFLVPLGMFLMLFGQIYLSQREKAQDFGIIDRSGLGVALRLTWARSNPLEVLKGTKQYIFKYVEDTPEAVEAAEKAIKEGTYSALIIVPEDVLETQTVQFKAKNITDHQVQRWLEDELTKIVRERKLRDRGIPRADVSAILATVDLDLEDITGKEQSAGQRLLIGFGSMFALYMMIAIYSGMIMNGFIEDKASRVMELLLSASSPRQILLGKVVGIGMVAITQVAIWVAVVFIVREVRPGMLTILLAAPASMYLFTAVYFVLGYFLYALLLSAVGAMCNSLQDAQQYSLPVFLPIITAMVCLSLVMREPDGPVSLALSLIPLTSPITMPALMGLTTVPPWQTAASLAILAATLPLIYMGASKLFRVALLMQGKTPPLKDIGKLLMAPEQ
ncbi:MAG: ABC transporter permease [Candidatus Sumerlaeia bacterium]|nr:ABC transporter permease [Candidatus Sumerlaeia bacterium]